MSKQLSQVVASRLNMQPALISPAFGALVTDALRQLASMDSDHEDQAQLKSRADMLSAYGYRDSLSVEKPYAFAEGVAFIPITGLLINRFNSGYGWVTGYNYIRSMMHAAIEDEDVKAIVFDCNSGGGEVAGCFELAADIVATRDKKPTMAVVDASSFSACYALASACTRIVVTPSAGVGSIGVVAMHMDVSKMLDEYGVKVTFIYSGDHKVDGNSYEPLPEPVRKSIQARVDNTRNEFVSLVATNRGLSTQVVFDTQAACFTSNEALALGLVDAIAPPGEAVRALLSGLSGSQSLKETTMSTKTDQAGAEIPTATPAENAAAPKGNETVTEAVDPKTAERARIKGIQGHANAAGKTLLANHLAMDTDLSVEAAGAILAAAAPEATETAVATASPFAAAMDTSDHPALGADTGSGELTPAQRILASQSLATGVKH